MIIDFTVENWMSFKDEVSFSMIASRERQHNERVPKIKKHQMRLLPISAIYGGNASGKSNFVKAIRFAQKLIVDGTGLDKPIPCEPFILDEDSTGKPCSFKFTLLIDGNVYEFGFSVTRKSVIEEKLVQISSTSEKTLYQRTGDKIKWDRSLEKDDFLKFAFRGTDHNQLFLTNSVSQKVENFRSVYDWFKDQLVTIEPTSRFANFELLTNKNSPISDPVNQVLSHIDTGINRLGTQDINLENFPESLLKDIREDLDEKHLAELTNEKERIIFQIEDGDLKAKRLIAYHPKQDGSEIPFDMDQVSDGSKRVVDLLPAFVSLARPDSNKVYIIDELDRSLHTILLRELLEAYLLSCNPESRSQLIFTTHDVLLMDQNLLRRDEMWVAEKNSEFTSNLISFAEYKDIRNDKDIRKSYLQGRFGGIPRILLGNSLQDSSDCCHKSEK